MDGIGKRPGTAGEVGRFSFGHGGLGGPGVGSSAQPGAFNAFSFNPSSQAGDEVTGFAMSDAAVTRGLQELLEVRTRRLLLRPLGSDDFESLTSLLASNAAALEAVGIVLAAEIGSDRGAYEQFLADLAFLRAIDQRLDLGVFADDELLGMVGLHSMQRGQIEMAAAMAWVDGAHAGRGYVPEALAGLLRLAFDDLALHRVEAAMLPDNTAARRVVAKLGFEDEGLARRWGTIKGVWRDHCRTSITVEDWNARRDEYTALYGV
jgi:[ribosomal protein S5]-alanine N-acetyltransferase